MWNRTTCLIVMIILVLIVMMFLVCDTKIESFRSLDSQCTIHKIIDKDFCSSKYSNLGQIQLLQAIIENPSDKELLQTAYQLKEDNNLFDEPCTHVLSKLRKPSSNSYSQEPYYPINMDSNVEEKYGKMHTWAHCYHTSIPGSLPKNSTNIQYTTDRVTFLNNSLEETRNDICSNQDFFIKSDQNSPCSSSPCLFLKIKCFVISKDDPVEIGLESIRVVSYSKENKFEEISETTNPDSSVFQTHFFTMAYDSKVLKFIPYIKKHRFIKTVRDICGNYHVVEEIEDRFDVGKLGIYSYKIYDNQIGLYNIDSSDYDAYRPGVGRRTIDRMRSKIVSNIETYKLDILDKILLNYRKCKTRLQYEKNRLYNAGKTELHASKQQDVNVVNSFIRNVRNVSDKNLRNDQIPEAVTMLANIEKDAYTACLFNRETGTDAQKIKEVYDSCLLRLSSINKENPTEDVTAVITEINRFNEYYRTQNLENLAQLTTIQQKTLKNFSERIQDKCSSVNSDNKMIKTRTKQIDIMIEKANNTVFDDRDLNVYDRRDDMVLKIDNSILKYISQDNCIYIKI